MTGTVASEDRLDRSLQEYACTHAGNEFLHLKKDDKSRKTKKEKKRK